MRKIISYGALIAAVCTTTAAVGPAAADSTLLTFGTKSNGAAIGRAFPVPYGASIAFPAPKGTAFAALTYSSGRDDGPDNDGDGDLVFGLTAGNPITGISATLAVNILSVEPSNFGDSGNFSLSFARALNVTDQSATAVGLTIGDLAGWGDAADNEESYKLYLSHLTSLNTASGPYPFMVTAGYATDNTFRDDGSSDDGAFIGLGIGVAPRLSLGMSATETQLNIGMTTTVDVPGTNGFGVTLGVNDVTDNVDRQEFSLTIGYAIGGLF